MFTRKPERPNTATAPSGPVMKFFKPRILAIDIDTTIVRPLRQAGYNVTDGTFGKAYKYEKKNSFRPVNPESAKLPELNEQEILIVDLHGSGFGPVPDPQITDEVEYYWQSCLTGVINPRPLAMWINQDAFKKVFDHAGVCIVLTTEFRHFEYFLAKSRGNSLYHERETLTLESWQLLTDLRYARVTNESGKEITYESNSLANLLSRGADGAEYHCSFQVPVNKLERWEILAKNKYSNTVAGLYINDDATKYILLLPRMPNLGRVIVELLESHISQWRPSLFPHLEGATWVHRPEYEIAMVNMLEREITITESDAKRKVESLRGQMEELRKANKDWYTLLNGTGNELAQAVINSFRKLGFQNVVDVDVEEKKKGNKSLREDIQVHDARPILIIDVKGINDCPSDDEAAQSLKHAMMRMKEWKHTEVKPLTIVNHQRHVPPLDRNATVYRPEIEAIADDQELGLMTTWDLYRILRNKEELKWPAESVKAIFYRSGVVDPIPAHYEYLGTVAKVWTDKFGVVLEQGEIRVGDRIAVEYPIIFQEITVGSILVDDQKVEHAKKGDRAGFLWDHARPKIKEGSRVYRVALPT